jgi:hypothetical protein
MHDHVATLKAKQAELDAFLQAERDDVASATGTDTEMSGAGPCSLDVFLQAERDAAASATDTDAEMSDSMLSCVAPHRAAARTSPLTASGQAALARSGKYACPDTYDTNGSDDGVSEEY